jgi:putative spermidine/putrescine transport system substrate-binding protein
MKQLFLASLLGSTIAMCTAAMAADDLKTLEAAAKAEGAVNSVGMPDDWANWKGTWEDLAKTYGLKHIDTDMSSAQEIAKFAAEKDNASADIGDVGAAFGPIAVKQGVTQPYKPSTWDQVPAWAKDKDGTGHWPTPAPSPSSSTRSCCTVPMYRPSGPTSRKANTRSPSVT